MKIRNGFVSNSSSSSFVVALACAPGELTEDWVKETFKLFYQEQITRLTGDLKTCSPKVIDPEDYELIARLLTEYEHPNRWELNNDPEYKAATEAAEAIPWGSSEEERHAYRKALKPYRIIQKQRSDALHVKVIEEFLKENKGKYLYELTYSGNDGRLDADLEHGDHWYYAGHITYSQH
jgi:hypothetical protein